MSYKNPLVSAQTWARVESELRGEIDGLTADLDELTQQKIDIEQHIQVTKRALREAVEEYEHLIGSGE